MSKALFIGEPKVIYSTHDGSIHEATTFTASVGGAELNSAIGASRLGVESLYYTHLGTGIHAMRVRSFMKQNGLSDELIITNYEHPTGFVFRSHTEHGVEHSCFLADTAPCHITADDMDRLDLSDIHAIFMTSNFPWSSDTAANAAERIIERAREHCITFVFNHRGSLMQGDKRISLINSIAEKADIFLSNITEAEELCGINEADAIAEHYLSLGTKKVIITMSKKGAFFKSRMENGIVPTFAADEIISTVGTRDGFAAGLISGVCDDLPLSEAVIRANAVASMQLHTDGTTEHLPTMKQLREYMLDHRFVVKHLIEE